MGKKNKGRFGRLKRARRVSLRWMLTESQNHRCAYCGFEMFNPSYETMMDFAKRTGIAYPYVKRHLDVSIDHVDPKGDNNYMNMVACHSFCNNTKKSTDAIVYFQTVQEQITTGSHPIQRQFNRGLDGSRIDPSRKRQSICFSGSYTG